MRTKFQSLILDKIGIVKDAERIYFLQERLDNAVAQKLSVRDDLAFFERVSTLWNYEKCPEEFLPYLAWAVGVEVWDNIKGETPEDVIKQKREVIKRWLDIRKLKGTRASINKAFEAIGLVAEIKEWWETGSDPYTFEIEVKLATTGQIVTQERRELIVRLLNTLKPLRSTYNLSLVSDYEASLFTELSARQIKIVSYEGVI